MKKNNLYRYFIMFVILASLVGWIHTELNNQSSGTWIAIFVLSTVNLETTGRYMKLAELWKDYGIIYKLWLISVIGLLIFYTIILIFC